jgi:CubicO group peptidase (beta-lactamase class C family)
MKTANVLLLTALIALTSCLREEDLKRPFVSFTPVELNDGWTISSPAAENISGAGLTDIYRDFHSDQDLWQVRSLLVFRNGKLVAESYTKDERDRTTPRAIWSCTKQVVGLLTGIALDLNIIGSVEDSIGEYLAEVHNYPDKQDIRIEHFLTMESGINYSNDGLEGQTDDILRQLPDHITDFILGRPLANDPGTISHYKDCDPQIVAAVIQQASGMPLDEWAWDVLFRPLQIQNLNWDRYKDGTTFGGFGILTTPREMAKFGQCVLDSGTWNGTRVVSKDWIKEMTTARVGNIYSNQFCYLWWKDNSREMTFMSGHGGQYVCIIPSKNLIVVMTAEVNTQGEFQFSEGAFDWVDRIVQITN